MYIFLSFLEVSHGSFLLEMLLNIYSYKYIFTSLFRSIRKLSLKTAFKPSLRQDKCQHREDGG